MVSPNAEGIDAIPIVVRDTEKLSDEKTCRLKQLIRLNHVNYSILYNSHRFHNHGAHFLGAAYLLGSSVNHLDEIYDDAVVRDNLEPWKPSPGKITADNYRFHLGKGEYQRAWVDFFQEQIRNNDSHKNWQSVATKFLFDTGHNGDANSAPMFDCLGVTLGHPLIHLGYAFELNSPEVAVEALGLTAGCYDSQFASLFILEPASFSLPSGPTSDLFELFQRVYNDKKLPTFPHPGEENVDYILDHREHLNALFVHFNSWDITNPTRQLLQVHRLASLFLISTAPKLGGHGYDFFIVHVLTTAHAVRVLLPHLPIQYQVALLRQWVLIALLVYVAQDRPRLDLGFVQDFELQGRGWEYVHKEALEGAHAMDAHFVKACRAMQVGAETWDNEEDADWFLKCAVRFVSEFEGWDGFNTEGEDAELTRMHRIRDGIQVR